ncbi:MAG: hypothetical protein V3R84_02555 [Acidimicrobiia bacterium]
MTHIAMILAMVGALIALNRYARRHERDGDWDKEGHGTPEHQEPGVKFRPLEAPPSEPFN